MVTSAMNRRKTVPQGVKPSSFLSQSGTAEAVPFVESFSAACKVRAWGFSQPVNRGLVQSRVLPQLTEAVPFVESFSAACKDVIGVFHNL
jgi:hypothetical protein